MKTVLGVDLGATTTDLVLLRKKRVLKKQSFNSIKTEKLGFLLKSNPEFLTAKKVFVTGGNSWKTKNKVLGIKTVKVNEINAIGKGGLFLAKKRSALIASIGTGTCIVNAKKKSFKHMKGTGFSGGSIVGLCKYIGVNGVKNIQEFALKGQNKKTDLTIKEVVGKKIGVLPETATASNFALLKKNNKPGFVFSLLKAVAEVNAVIIWQASVIANQKKVIVTGRLPTMPLFKNLLLDSFKLLKLKPVIPKNCEIATAIGATL